MRLSYGRLTRKLPAMTPLPADVWVVTSIDEEGTRYVVAPVACGWGETLYLSSKFTRRKDATAAAWRLAAIRGGRLLDYQGRTLAEQPLRWSVTLRWEPEVLEAHQGFAPRTTARQHLARALSWWAGLPRNDARAAAAQLVAGRGQAVLALTQTESRSAQKPPEGLRPALAAIVNLLSFHPLDVLPEAVRLGGTP